MSLSKVWYCEPGLRHTHTQNNLLHTRKKKEGKKKKKKKSSRMGTDHPIARLPSRLPTAELKMLANEVFLAHTAVYTAHKRRIYCRTYC